MFLKKLIIKESTFFGDRLELSFSSKLNCIMGGRGSGKTTILSLINWALRSEDEISKENLSLVKANLGAGVIELIFQDDNGYQLSLSKNFGASPSVKDATGNHISIDEFKSKVSIDYFLAGSIERIGVDPKERLKIFDGFIGDDIEEIKARIGILVSQLKQNEFEIKSGERELSQIKEELQNYGNLDGEIQKAKEEFAVIDADSGVKEKFESENKNQTKRSFEQNFLNKIKESIFQLSESRKATSAALISTIDLLKTGPLENLSIENFRKEALGVFEKSKSQIIEIENSIKDLGVKYVQTSKETKDEHQKAESQFSDLKQAIAKHRDLFQRLNGLTQKETARKLTLDRQQKVSVNLEATQSKRNSLLADLEKTTSNRYELRTNQANLINSVLGEKVRILIKSQAQNDAFQDVIRTVLSKAQMRATSVEFKMFEISNSAELAKYFKADDSTGYAAKLNISTDRVSELFNSIRSFSAIYDLETCICEDSPNFFLAVEDSGKNTDIFKPTEQLSTGQRCTAILPIIFAVTNNPLLIDQPEDNLDNRYITHSIHHIIRGMKERRQLIFVTHNPNIPVISDSEYNAFLSYADSLSHVTSAGDIGQVKAQIIELLEGGEEAFVKRRDFYGY